MGSPKGPMCVSVCVCVCVCVFSEIEGLKGLRGCAWREGTD